jgi:hypothetical protein
MQRRRATAQNGNSVKTQHKQATKKKHQLRYSNDIKTHGSS